MHSDPDTLDEPKVSDQTPQQPNASCQNPGASTHRRRLKQLHELYMSVGWRRGIVDPKEIDAGTGCSLKGQPQTKKVRIRLPMRASETGREPPQPDMFGARFEQADPGQVHRELEGDLELDLATSDLILMRHSIPHREVRIVRDQLFLDARDCAYVVINSIHVFRTRPKQRVRNAVRSRAHIRLPPNASPGGAPQITADAKAWLVSLACQKAKGLRYPHELWTTRLLAGRVRTHAAAAGRPKAELKASILAYLANLNQHPGIRTWTCKLDQAT